MAKEIIKKWYLSKGVWLGVITAAIGTLDILAVVIETGDMSPQGIVLVSVGILKVFERVLTGTRVKIVL